jgi:hypothetical protein
MMRAGYRYAKRLHEEGQLTMLAPIARDRFGHDELVHEPRSPSRMAGVGGKGRTGVGAIYSGGREPSVTVAEAVAEEGAAAAAAGAAAAATEGSSGAWRARM